MKKKNEQHPAFLNYNNDYEIVLPSLQQWLIQKNKMSRNTKKNKSSKKLLNSNNQNSESLTDSNSLHSFLSTQAKNFIFIIGASSEKKSDLNQKDFFHTIVDRFSLSFQNEDLKMQFDFEKKLIHFVGLYGSVWVLVEKNKTNQNKLKNKKSNNSSAFILNESMVAESDELWVKESISSIYQSLKNSPHKDLYLV